MKQGVEQDELWRQNVIASPADVRRGACRCEGCALARRSLWRGSPKQSPNAPYIARRTRPKQTIVRQTDGVCPPQRFLGVLAFR